MHINDYDFSMAMNDVSDVNRKVERLEKRVETLERILAAHPERTAKVIEHDASITDTDGYKYLRTEYICGACKKKVIGGDEYYSHCGARLEWNHE